MLPPFIQTCKSYNSFFNLNFILRSLPLFKLNLILTSLSILMFTFSMFSLTQNELRFNGLGLFSVLPLTYFASLFILVISFVLSLYLYEKSKYLLIFQTLELITFLFLMPLLVEGTPRFAPVFIIGGEIDYILRNSFLNPEIARYHNWPSAEIFGVSFILITNLSLDTFFSFTPFISQIIYLFIVFSIFTVVFNDKIKVWISCWIFFSNNWLNQDYFCPQNMAFFLYLIILLLLFRLILENKHKLENKFEVVVIAFVIVTAHVLTSLLLLLNTLSFALVNYKRKLNTNFFSLAFFIFIIFISWEVFGATVMFTKIIHILLDAVSLEVTRADTVHRMSSGSNQHLRVVQVRILSTLLLYFIASLGLISKIKQIKNVVPSIMILLIISTLGMFGAGGYGGEIMIRIVLFSLIPLSYFAAHNFDNRLTKVILIVFLIISPLFHIVGHYGSEAVDYTAPDDLKGAKYFFSHAPLYSSSITGYLDELRSNNYIENFEKYNFDSFKSRNSLVTRNNYIWLTLRGEQAASFIDNDLQFYNKKVSGLNFDPSYYKIYSNKNFKIYLET